MTTISLRRCVFRNFTLFKRPVILKNYPRVLAINHSPFYNVTHHETVFHPRYSIKLYSQNSNRNEETTQKLTEKEEKPGLLKRFQQMYRDYWYVLVPVHLITSAGWFGGFYYMAKSGVDVVPLLENIGLSEKIVGTFRDSSMGYLAISYALYKIATPIRYTVTIGGTTISINYLKDWGYIKPVPSKDKLKEMYMERKEHFRETIEETKEELRQRKDQLKERKDNILGDYANFKKELKDIKAQNIQKLPEKIFPTVKDK